MATYILLSRLTDAGRQTMKSNAARLKEVNDEVESMGARIKEQLALMGDYDFLTVLEAPTNEVTARIAVELGSRGTVTIMSLPAIDVNEYIDMLTGRAAGGD